MYVPCSFFVSKIDNFRGPEVTIIVDSQSFNLPKALLCYNSPFFDRAFNGAFKEAGEQSLSLTSCSIETFKVLVQWLYTSQIVLDEDETEQEPVDVSSLDDEGILREAFDSMTRKETSEISRLLDFLRLADEIQLLGPFDSIVNKIKTTIISEESSLKAHHIRTASNLPIGHSARKLLAQACVVDYAKYCFLGHEFGSHTVMNELEGFAADLLKEFGVAMQKVYKVKGKIYYPDPLNGYKGIQLHASSSA